MRKEGSGIRHVIQLTTLAKDINETVEHKAHIPNLIEIAEVEGWISFMCFWNFKFYHYYMFTLMANKKNGVYMPRLIAQGFDDFLTIVKATKTDTTLAKSHRASIEACLKSNFGLNRFIRMGSFGNGTNVSGYSDFDYLACIPTAQLTKTSTCWPKLSKSCLGMRFSI